MTEETLFEMALNTPESERPALLGRECVGNVALRARVEALLAAHFAGGSRFSGQGDETIDVRPGPRGGVHGAGGPPGKGVALPAPGAGPSASDTAGTVLGEKYRLIEPIGEGGMGTVWRASQVAPVKREVAVKLIKPGMDSRAVLARFDAERQALALMDHPNIARVLDAGLTAGGRPFFVMELVRGTPITQFCDARRMTPEQRLGLFVPVCQAIQHAHQKGVIHRDVKPSNVLVALYDDRAVPKVIDFGVAKATGQALTDHTIHTAFGGVIGTPQYMSPEQATFNNLDIDTRTDVYSLGALLYELLTGSPPFSAEELERKGVMEILRVVREEEPPKPSTRLRTASTLPALSASRSTEPGRLASLLRSELDWLVLKALEKDRARRYETASALAADVERYLQGEPVQAHPPTAGYRLAKFLRRHRGPAIAAGLLTAALVAGVVGTSVGMIRAEAARAGESRQRRVALAQSKQAQDRAADLAVALRDVESERERAERSLANGRILLAEAAWKGAGTASQATDALKEVPERFRGWEYAHLERKYQGAYATLYGHTDYVNQVAFHPDGSRVASASQDGTVRIWDASSTECLSVLAGNNAARATVAYSPDGRRLAVTTDKKQILLYDTASGTLVREFAGSIGEDEHVAFSPDGSRFAYIAEGVVHVADADTGASRLALDGVPGIITSVAFSPDGAWVAAAGRSVSEALSSGGESTSDLLGRVFPASDDPEELGTYRGTGTLHVWDSRSGALRFEQTFPEGGVVCLAYSPDGEQIALRFTDQTMHIRRAADGKLVRAFPHHGQVWVFGPSRVTFSPDGTQVATPYMDQSLIVWDVATGARAWTRPATPGSFSFDPPHRFSPDNRYLLAEAGSATLELWDRGTAQRVARLKGMARDSHLAFSPDGRRVATASPDHSVQLWDLSPGQSPFRLSHPAGIVNAVAFSPDGRTIASASEDQVIRLWDAATGHRLANLEGHTAPVTSLAFSPDGSRLLSGAESTTKLLDSEAEQDSQVLQELAGLSAQDARRLVTDEKEEVLEAEARVWDTATGKLLRSLPGHQGDIRDVAWSPDGTLMATCSDDETIRLWNSADGSVRRVLKVESEHVLAVAFSPDGKRLATGSTGGRLRVWDTASGRCLQELVGHGGTVFDVAFHPDGKRLASAGLDDSIRIWELSTGGCRHVLRDYRGRVQKLAWSPDGDRLASTSIDGKVRIWDPESETHLVDLDAFGEDTSCLAFSPDGRRLVAGTTESSSLFNDKNPELVTNLVVWEGQALAPPTEWPGHSNEVRRLAIQPDGARLASAAADDSLRIWDTATGRTIREIREIRDLQQRTDSLGLSADGSRVVSETFNDEVRVWDVATGKELTAKEQAWPDGVVASETITARSPDGRFLYVGTPRGSIQRIALELTPQERDYRRRVGRPDPLWHRQQALEAEERELWRTAAFHWKWVTQYEPDDAEAKTKRAAAEAKLEK